jgi:hypothetical protein
LYAVKPWSNGDIRTVLYICGKRIGFFASSVKISESTVTLWHAALTGHDDET